MEPASLRDIMLRYIRRMWHTVTSHHLSLASVTLPSVLHSCSSSRSAAFDRVNCSTESTRLTTAAFFTFFARIAKRSDECVSGALSDEGEQATSIIVFELPPSDS